MVTPLILASSLSTSLLLIFALLVYLFSSIFMEMTIISVLTPSLTFITHSFVSSSLSSHLCTSSTIGESAPTYLISPILNILTELISFFTIISIKTMIINAFVRNLQVQTIYSILQSKFQVI
jgi:hypothetical protein